MQLSYFVGRHCYADKIKPHPSPNSLGEGAVLCEFTSIRNAGEVKNISCVSTVKNSSPFTAHFSLKSAFTLAEVLITLAIIGVVAAMTLPTLIAKHQEKELIVQMRKFFADFNNAARLSQVENDGNIDYSTVFNPNNTHIQTAQAFAKYFNGAKVCESPAQKGCSKYYYKIKYSTEYNTQESGKNNYSIPNSYPAIILNNGSILYIYQANTPDCHAYNPKAPVYDHGEPVIDPETGEQKTYIYEDFVCALVYFDTNGVKGPNQYGRDASRLRVEKTKIIPSAQPYEGKSSLVNVLLGKDELIYDKF